MLTEPPKYLWHARLHCTGRVWVALLDRQLPSLYTLCLKKPDPCDIISPIRNNY